ncbi:MAG: glutamine--fructose-6-phosphate transaminase (isomerizing) [Alphaproteobacteria bacterium]|nr:glutamine--fructose-6-phosphate transaminase (isomerizing) [Alphaproteobacteria bacterium]
MCGIIGIVSGSKEDIVSSVIEGLSKLEYRGYDSAGIAVLSDGNLQRRRAVGKLENLENKLEEDPINGTVGIGHTRWATHGKPTEENAHPMMTKDVALVHNGIIENYKSLKDSLITQGYNFTSQTDTEVVAVYMQSCIDKGSSPREAFRQMLKVVEGTFAFVAIFKSVPNKIFCAKNKSPIVIGFGKNMCVGSDASSIAGNCDEVVYLSDGEYAEVTEHDAIFFDENFCEIKKERQKVTDDLINEGLGQYPHYMLKEIMEQPNAVRKTIVANEIPVDLLKNVSRILILACGTSYYAGMVARYWFEKYLKIPTNVEMASEYRYRFPVIENGTLVIGITQSGETIDTLEAMEYARSTNSNCRVLAISNVKNSAIARSADVVFYTEAGVEIGVASTKAFMAQLTVLAMIAFHDRPEVLNELRNFPNICDDILSSVNDEIENLAKNLYSAQSIIYLGRDSLYPIALEGALKLKEISYIHAEGFAAGEMKHGPIALIDDNLPVICLCPSCDVFDKMVSNIQIAKARGKNVIVFTDSIGNETFGDDFKKIVLPNICQECVPLAYVIPMQLLAYKVAVLKGEDVDKPRNLAKSVTVE